MATQPPKPGMPRLERFAALGAAIGAFLAVHMYLMPALNSTFTGRGYAYLATNPAEQPLAIFNAIFMALFYTVPFVILIAIAGGALLLLCGVALRAIPPDFTARRITIALVAGVLAAAAFIPGGLSTLFWAIDAGAITLALVYCSYTWLTARREAQKVVAEALSVAMPTNQR